MINPSPHLIVDPQATEATRRRYPRNAPFYDLMQLFSERRFRPWRARLWRLVSGPSILEVGIGTGHNIPFYPSAIQVTGIDLTAGMLERANRKAAQQNRRITLQLRDVQQLGFPDASFDQAVATCVFCSVPDPILGLSELRRVVKPGGQVLLIEHVRSPNPKIGRWMDWINPWVVRMMGANINGDTVTNVRSAGWRLDRVEPLDRWGIFLLIQASAV